MTRFVLVAILAVTLLGSVGRAHPRRVQGKPSTASAVGFQPELNVLVLDGRRFNLARDTPSDVSISRSFSKLNVNFRIAFGTPSDRIVVLGSVETEARELDAGFDRKLACRSSRPDDWLDGGAFVHIEIGPDREEGTIGHGAPVRLGVRRESPTTVRLALEGLFVGPPHWPHRLGRSVFLLQICDDGLE